MAHGNTAVGLLLRLWATFLAAVASYGLRRFTIGGLPVLSGLMPVLFNAVLVGWEL